MPYVCPIDFVTSGDLTPVIGLSILVVFKPLYLSFELPTSPFAVYFATSWFLYCSIAMTSTAFSKLLLKLLILFWNATFNSGN